MSKRYSGKSFKDSSVMKKAKLSFKEKRKLKIEKKKKEMKKILLTIFIFLLFNKITSADIVDELTKLNNLYKEGAINKVI